MAEVFNRAGYATMRTCKKGNSYAAANRKFQVVRDATKRGGTAESGSAWHGDQVINYLSEGESTKAEDPFLIYFGFSHPLNFFAKLLGPDQNAPRAELRAALGVLLVSNRPTRIRADCQFVVDGIRAIVGGAPWKHYEHQDLWTRVYTEIRRLGAHAVDAAP